MQKRVKTSRAIGNAGSPTWSSRAFASLPIVAFFYVLVLRPFVGNFGGESSGLTGVQAMMAPDWKNKTFWPLIALSTILLALILHSRLDAKRLWSPPIVSLAAYMAFSGASILWAYHTEYAFSRFSLEMMIVVTLVLPFALAAPTADLIRNIYICYVVSIVLNTLFVLNQNPVLTASGSVFGYFGYFSFKQYLGESASIMILLACHEMFYPGRRRYIAILVAIVSFWLIFASKSKGSLAFLLAAPVLGAIALVVSNKIRTSMVAVLATIPLFYIAASVVYGNVTNRVSYMFYGDSTLTGRTVIWDFIQYQMSRKPWFGWGFHSFWLVGPDAPSVVEAPGWIKHMTGSHSGYLDVRLETGNIGFAIFLVFIITSLYAMERVKRRDPLRAWLLISLALYVVITNLLETVWTVTDEPLWFIFVLIVAETTRYAKVPNHVAAATPRRGPLRMPRPPSRPTHQIRVARSQPS